MDRGTGELTVLGKGNKKRKVYTGTNARRALWRYPELAHALALIVHFESDLYQNAVVPIALAHRYTAISLVPGGRVLDLLTRRSLLA